MTALAAYLYAPPDAAIIGGDFMSNPVTRQTPMSRRRFLKKTAVAAGVFALPAVPFSARAAGPLKQVSMTLDWVFQGPNVGFMLAQDKGFYREAGLDVAFTPGKGSVSTAQLVASKAAQFGFADGFVVGNGAARGMGLRSIASIYRRNPAAVVVLADSGINSPKDLEGKSIAITAGSAQFQQWPAFVKGAGLDGTKIDVVNIDPTGVGAALINNKVPAIAGFAQGYVPSIEIRGKKETRIFWYADYGVTVVSNGIIVHNDLIASDPELVRAFVTPTIKGFLYGRKNPDEAVATVKKYLETVDPAITRLEMDLSWKTWVTPNTRDKALGWASDVDWSETVKVLKQYGGVTNPLAASELYTNEFVPTGADFVPPQEA
jgi:NitT/TauT family transport system substrate-binding protein